MAQYPQTIQYQIKTEPPFSAFPPIEQFTSWFMPLSEPVRQNRISAASQAPSLFLTEAIFTETVTLDKYYQWWSEPVRQRPGLRAQLDPFYFAEPFSQTQPERVDESKWHYPWSEPVRLKPGLRVYLQQFYTADTSTIPLTKLEPWFNWWSEPVRQKPRLIAGANPDWFYGNQRPLVSFSWFNWLAEPKRFKPGLGAHLQQSTTYDTKFVPSPGSFIQGWFTWLSEPVREKLGLKSHLQQFLATPPRLLPTPTTTATVTLNATETNLDVASFAVRVPNTSPPVQAVVSIKEIGPGDNPTSVWES